MKENITVVLLAGGRGTRLAEETEIIPKPMVEIGGRPLLWHIMKHYARWGLKDFVVALGYKGEIIKHYFVDALSNRRLDEATYRRPMWRLTKLLHNGFMLRVQTQENIDIRLPG